MSLPHFDQQDNLDSPPSFQRPSQGVTRMTGRQYNVRSKGKHGWVSNSDEEPREGAVTTTITSPTASCMTAATPPANSLAGMRESSKVPQHAFSSTTRTASLGQANTNTNPTQSGLALPVTKTMIIAARSTFFDPWNSSSSGHQRAENRLAGSTSWRKSRNVKLGEQFLGGLSGGANRMTDMVGAGSEEFGNNGQKANSGWEKGAKGLRWSGQQCLEEVWGASKDVKGSKEKLAPGKEAHNVRVCNHWEASTNVDLAPEAPTLQGQKQIFAGLCFYVNGSTAPLVSDLRLKQLLADCGGRTSLSLGRRSVTHVILGTANGQGGAGGGLAATKIQREMARMGGKGVKFVGVEWVLSSIRLNARQSESRFSSLKLAAKGQNSVLGTLGHSPSSKSISRDEKSEASNG